MMHFDDTEELREPKLCCYRKRWIASRALIWSFVSIGATLFSIGYVLKVFTAHYPDDPETASIFEISGLTLASVGASLTGLGIIACFHSCCVVLCYRPANKPNKKSGSQKSNATSEKSDQKSAISTLPVNENLIQPWHHAQPDLVIRQQQQQPLLTANGNYYPVSPELPSPPPPQRSATSPKFHPLKDENQPSWNHMRDSDRRRHQSQGNIRQGDWSDNDHSGFPQIVDKSPGVGQDFHPYADDYLHQQLRKKANGGEAGVGSRTGSTRSASNVPQPYQQLKMLKDSSQTQAKPLFKIGGPQTDHRDASRDLVWEHQQQIRLKDHSSKLEAANQSPQPPPRSANAVRHRQYFHEEHFTFSDFEPDDAFVPAHDQQHLLKRKEAASHDVIAPLHSRTPSDHARQSMRSPVQSGVVRSQPMSQPLYVNNSNISSSLRQTMSIPSAQPSSSVPVNTSSQVYYGKHKRNQSLPQQQNFSVEIDNSTPLPHQAPLSGGSTSSGRGSGSRGAVEISQEPAGGHQILFVQQGTLPSNLTMQQASAVTVSMASPCLLRKASPVAPRRLPDSSDFNRRQQYFTAQADVEMQDLDRIPNGRIRNSSPTRQPVSESAGFNASFHSSVIRGQLQNQQRYYSLAMNDGDDADIDNTSPDPEDAFPTPKKSPKPRNRPANNASDVQTAHSSAPFMGTIERLPSAAANRRSYGASSSSVLVSQVPAHDAYLTTQAFLCDNEEII